VTVSNLSDFLNLVLLPHVCCFWPTFFPNPTVKPLQQKGFEGSDNCLTLQLDLGKGVPRRGVGVLL
jgi:hypothetical protein